MIDKADKGDAAEILALQRLAYVSEAELYGDYRIPPLMQTQAELEDEFADQVILKLTVDGKIIGSVRGCERNGTCCVGRLIVQPDFQKRGYGSKLLAEIEEHFPGCGRFELFTGHKSAGNIGLYEKHGYRLFKTEAVNDALSFVYLEKIK